MAYALKGSCFQAAVHSHTTAQSKKPIRLAHAVVKAHHTPAHAAKQAKAAVGSLAASVSAAALLLALPANAVQAPTLFEGNTSYQQELQDLIDQRGSLPSLSPQDVSKAAADAKKAADKAVDKAEFKLPDVSKGAVEMPKELERALPEAVKNLPPPPTPTPSSSTPGQPKAEGSKLEAPKAPQLPKIEAPQLEAPKPSSLPTPPQPNALPQQDGGGLPTPYLAAGGVAAAAIVGIGLAGSKPDQAASSSPQSSGSAAPKSSGGSSGGMPEGKDPEMDSETARKKDPFFKEVDKRTK